MKVKILVFDTYKEDIHRTIVSELNFDRVQTVGRIKVIDSPDYELYLNDEWIDQKHEYIHIILTDGTDRIFCACNCEFYYKE